MRKWVITPGRTGLDALERRESEVPEPGPGEVRVKIRAVSLNYRDQIIMNGDYGQAVSAETVPASDASGVIDAIGPDVDAWAVGDNVISVYFNGWVDGPPLAGMGFGLGSPGEDGVLAEYVVLSADRLVAMPSSLGFAQAATLTCAGLTAWSALVEEHPVSAGQTVLTLGTGGVSIFALQLANAMGATVVATTSQQEKVDRLLELGASRVINYRTDENWGEIVLGETGGADKVVNAAGGDAMTQSIMAVAAGGEIAVMGLFSAGDVAPPLPILMAKGASIRGTSVGGSAALKALVDFIDAHDVKPIVQHTFNFDDVKTAYEAQAGAGVFGKIVIEVAP